MNYLKISIIALIITTILICLLKPQIRKRTVIGEMQFVVVPPQEQVVPQAVGEKAQPSQNVKTKLVLVPKVESKRQRKFGYPPERTNVAVQPNVVSKTTVSPKAKNFVAKNNTAITLPQVQNKSPKRQLTQEEIEIIAWNNWRSALQNKVMRDTKLSAPIGTVFKFSFTVDREGSISNLKTWSLNSDYTPMAVRVIKPAIMSYQGQSILNFPKESKRVITNVNGGFTVWYSTGYSSPSDYSDYERVK